MSRGGREVFGGLVQQGTNALMAGEYGAALGALLDALAYQGGAPRWWVRFAPAGWDCCARLRRVARRGGDSTEDTEARRHREEKGWEGGDGGAGFVLRR
jgi:hypothetical protein